MLGVHMGTSHLPSGYSYSITSAGCGVLSLRHFRLASWRSLSLGGGGRDSGAAHLDLLGPPGWCSGCWPHDGDVAAGGDFVLAILRFGADDGARAIGATASQRGFRSGVLAPSTP
jgi:hypothetical protein